MVESEYVLYQWSLIAREFGSMYALCVFGCRAGIISFLSATVIDRSVGCGLIRICLSPVVMGRSRIRFYACSMCVRWTCLPS